MLGAPLSGDPPGPWGEIGLVIFLGMFALVLAYTFRRANQRRFEEAARLPLDWDSQTEETQ